MGHGKLSFAVRCWEPGVTLSLGDCVCLTMVAWLRVMADHRWQELDGAVVNDATIRVDPVTGTIPIFMPDGITAHHSGGDSCRPLQSRSPVFALHPLAQDSIDPAEVSLALRFEPGQDIVVNAERDL